MANEPPNSTHLELLTIREVARRIKLTTRGLRKMISSGRFGPAILRLGARALRVRETELDAWIEAGCPGRDQFEAGRAGE